MRKMGMSEIRNGLVSTIIPVHNRPELLKESVASVLQQTYKNIEIIIVDDGSTDNTADVAKELRDKNPEQVQLIELDLSQGPGGAREQGRLIAQGEFIQYLDSDDLLMPNKFEVQVNSLLENPECGAAYGKTVFSKIGSQHEEAAWKRTGEKIEFMFPSFAAERWWDTSTPLYRRSVCDVVGAWASLRCEEDWEYDCRIAALGTKLVYNDLIVSNTRDTRNTAHASNVVDAHGILDDRSQARKRIWKSIKTAGLNTTTPEVAIFSRYAFLLSRQCGASGLAKCSKDLFYLAVESSNYIGTIRLQFRLYRVFTYLVGWVATGKLSFLLDRVRKK